MGVMVFGVAYYPLKESLNNDILLIIFAAVYVVILRFVAVKAA